MASIDDSFPNRLDCYFALFQDAVYEHDNNVNYVVQPIRRFFSCDEFVIVKAFPVVIFSYHDYCVVPFVFKYKWVSIIIKLYRYRVHLSKLRILSVNNFLRFS